jgi:hypothetical protein
LGILAVSLLAVSGGCSARRATPPREDREAGAVPWATTKVRVSLNPGPEGAPSIRYILRERSLALVPEGMNISLIVSAEFYEAVDGLRAQTSTSIGEIRRTHKLPAELFAYFSFEDAVQQLEWLSRNPAIRGALIRRAVEKSTWSPQAREASAALALARGPESEVTILPAASSKALAKSLKNIGAVEAIVVDVDGETIAATSRWFYPTIHKQTTWRALAQATGDKILVTPPFEEPCYDFPLRKVAVPVHASDGSTLIGWVLAKVYARGLTPIPSP